MNVWGQMAFIVVCLCIVIWFMLRVGWGEWFDRYVVHTSVITSGLKGAAQICIFSVVLVGVLIGESSLILLFIALEIAYLAGLSIYTRLQGEREKNTVEYVRYVTIPRYRLIPFPIPEMPAQKAKKPQKRVKKAKKPRTRPRAQDLPTYILPPPDDMGGPRRLPEATDQAPGEDEIGDLPPPPPPDDDTTDLFTFPEV